MTANALSSLQMEAVRHDFMGGSCRTIGEKVGRSHTIIWQWRKLPAYQEALRQMHEDANRATVASAQKTRDDALKVARAALTRLGQRLAKNDGNDMSNSDLASTVRASLDVYKTTAAQTGISERKTVEHAGEVTTTTVQVVVAEDIDDAIFGDDEE